MSERKIPPAELPDGRIEWLMQDTFGDLEALPRPPDWQYQAACLGKPTEWWFPEKGRSPQRAIEVCEGCPVRVECAHWALAEGFDTGVFGGLTAQARKAETASELKSQRRRQTPRSCACGCGRMVAPGRGRKHSACRQREWRERHAA